MIKLLSAMLAEHVVDSHAGMAIIPLLGNIADDKRRGQSVKFPLECIAVVNLYGGREDEPFSLSGAICGPDITDIDLGTHGYTWPPERAMSVYLTIKVNVPINAGGLYEVKINLNDEHLVSLGFLINWDEF